MMPVQGRSGWASIPTPAIHREDLLTHSQCRVHLHTQLPLASFRIGLRMEEGEDCRFR